jgi:mono/diheme cytochrome c family protein
VSEDVHVRRSIVPVLSLLLVASACGSTEIESTGPGRPTDGAGLYAASCSACHGSDLRGTQLGPSLLSIVYEPSHHPDESFRSAIRNGVKAHHWNFGDMPPVTGLTDEEIELVIAHVRSVQEAEGFEP